MVVRVPFGIQRILVIQVVHAAHLLLDGSGNRLFDALSCNADIYGNPHPYSCDDPFANPTEAALQTCCS
jgi:hypothetical protein